MTNLTEKIDELQAQLATQHTELLAAFTTANGRLLNIADRLQFPFAAGPNESAAQWLSRINTNLTSLRNTEVTLTNTRLASIITLIGTTNTNTAGTNTLLGTTNTSLASLLTALGPNVGANLVSMLEYLSDMDTLINTIKTYIGVPGDATEYIIPLLRTIQNCVCFVASALPSQPTTAICEDPFTSGSQVFYPSWDGFSSGVNVAQWFPPLPEGVSYGSTMGITEDNTELVIDGTWAGSWIWVESSAPNFAISTFSTQRYSCNEWVQLPDTPYIAVSVANQYSVKAYICMPEVELDPGCFVVGSVLQSDGDYVALTSTIPGIEPFLYEGSNALLKDAGHYNFTVVEATEDVTMVIYHPGAGGYITNTPLPGESAPDSGGHNVYVRSDGPFTAIVCVEELEPE